MDSGLHQAPLSMGISRQQYWSGLPFPSPTSELNDLIKGHETWGKGAYDPKMDVTPEIKEPK